MISEAAIARIRARVDREVAPPAAPPHLVEWCRSIVRVRGKDGVPEGYVPEQHPPQYFLLRAIGDALLERGPFRRIINVKPTQDGGTTIGQSAPQLYTAGVLGDPVVVGLPDMRLVGVQWRDKTQLLLRDSGLMSWMPTEGPGSEGASNPIELLLNDKAKLHWMGAGASNEAGQAMITGRLLTRDEFDAMEAYLAALMTGRQDFFGGRSVTIDTSTIKHDVDSPIWQAFEASTAGHVEYACPRCGAWSWWRWKDVRADWSSAPAAQASVVVVCPRNGCVFDDRARRFEMIRLENARLVMRGQHVDEAGVVQGPLPETLDWGLFWSAIDSPLTDLADLAVKFQTAKGKASEGNDAELRRFYRDRDCRAYVPEISDREISNTALKRQSDRSDLHKRVLPEWTEFITVGQDVQGDRHYWLALACTGDMSQMAIVDWGYEYLVEVERDALGTPLPARPVTPADRLAVLEKIHDICQQGWQIQGSAERMKPVRCTIDTGYLQDEVVPWVVDHRGDWILVKGVGRDQAMKMDRTAIKMGKSLLPAPLAVALLGKVDVRQPDTLPLPLVNVHGHEMRLALQAALMRSPGQTPICWLPQGLRASDYLLLHLSAEVWTEIVTNGAGTGKWYWREVRRNQNHLLDCVTYAYAIAVYHREVMRFTATDSQASSTRISPSPASSGGEAITDLQRQRPHSRLLRR